MLQRREPVREVSETHRVAELNAEESAASRPSRGVVLKSRHVTRDVKEEQEPVEAQPLLRASQTEMPQQSTRDVKQLPGGGLAVQVIRAHARDQIIDPRDRPVSRTRAMFESRSPPASRELADVASSRVQKEADASESASPRLRGGQSSSSAARIEKETPLQSPNAWLKTKADGASKRSIITGDTPAVRQARRQLGRGANREVVLRKRVDRVALLAARKEEDLRVAREEEEELARRKAEDSRQAIEMDLRRQVEDEHRRTDSLQAQLNELVNCMKEQDRLEELARQDRVDLQRQMDKTEKRGEKLKVEWDTFQKQMEEMQLRGEAIRKDMQELDSQMAGISSKAAEHKDQEDEFKASKEKLQRQVDEMQAQVEVQESRHAAVQDKLKQVVKPSVLRSEKESLADASRSRRIPQELAASSKLPNGRRAGATVAPARTAREIAKLERDAPVEEEEVGEEEWYEGEEEELLEGEEEEYYEGEEEEFLEGYEEEYYEGEEEEYFEGDEEEYFLEGEEEEYLEQPEEEVEEDEGQAPESDAKDVVQDSKAVVERKETKEKQSRADDHWEMRSRTPSAERRKAHAAQAPEEAPNPRRRRAGSQNLVEPKKEPDETEKVRRHQDHVEKRRADIRALETSGGHEEDSKATSKEHERREATSQTHSSSRSKQEVLSKAKTEIAELKSRRSSGHEEARAAASKSSREPDSKRSREPDSKENERSKRPRKQEDGDASEIVASKREERSPPVPGARSRRANPPLRETTSRHPSPEQRDRPRGRHDEGPAERRSNHDQQNSRSHNRERDRNRDRDHDVKAPASKMPKKERDLDQQVRESAAAETLRRSDRRSAHMDSGRG